MIGVQAVLSIILIESIRKLGFPYPYQAAGPAMALMLALGLSSVLKARLLSRILGAPVQGWRWPLIWAAAAAAVVGWLLTRLPRSWEWAELSFGIPAILVVFGAVVWKRGFTHEDRELFRTRKGEVEEPTLPPPGDVTAPNS
jgi:peptidoglycan biosynthesis protein MviN/MurJ (putative lipid II flippase)